MKKLIKLVVLFTAITSLMAACGGDTGGGGASEPLELGDDEYYVVRATGAISDTNRGTGWGDFPNDARGLFDEGDYRILAFTGGNQPGEVALSSLRFVILEDLEPGTYDVTGDTNVAYTNYGLTPENPVKLLQAEVRYPDYEILNDADEVSGSMTFDTISSDGMSGSIDITLSGEGGDVQVDGVFDVPVVEEDND
jgi:hypothetical protein